MNIKSTDIFGEESPFEDVFDDLTIEDESIVIDMTEHAGIENRALRVELRRTRDPATGIVSTSKKLLDSNFIVGLIKPEDLPVEGKSFRMPYHSFNALADFGSVDTQTPVTSLVIDDDCYYFRTEEGQWRLKILDAGN